MCRVQDSAVTSQLLRCRDMRKHACNRPHVLCQNTTVVGNGSLSLGFGLPRLRVSGAYGFRLRPSSRLLIFAQVLELGAV